MLWFRIPEKIYFKKGCMWSSLDELKTVYGKKRAFIVADNELYKKGYVNSIGRKLKSVGIQCTVFSNIPSEITFECIAEGAKAMSLFGADTVISFGTYKSANAAKLMRAFYEKPDLKPKDLIEKFVDLRNTEEIFSKENRKSLLAIIPVLYGNGSEVTPYAFVKDEMNDSIHIAANYSLMPDISIIDSDYTCELPEILDNAPGFAQLTLAISAYISEFSSEYTDGFVIKAVKNIFEYLPYIYQNGTRNVIAEEKISEASAMAGIAAANTDAGLLCGLDIIYGGLVCAVLLPCVIRRLIKDNANIAEKLTEMAKLLGMNDAEALISNIEELRDKCGLAKSISELKTEKADYFSAIEKLINPVLREAYE